LNSRPHDYELIAGLFPKDSDYANRYKFGFVILMDKEEKGLNLNIG
jgi:hypothetical protein